MSAGSLVNADDDDGASRTSSASSTRGVRAEPGRAFSGVRLKLYANGDSGGNESAKLHILQAPFVSAPGDEQVVFDLVKLHLAEAMGNVPADHPIMRRTSFASGMIAVYLLPYGDLVESVDVLRENDALAIELNGKPFFFPRAKFWNSHNSRGNSMNSIRSNGSSNDALTPRGSIGERPGQQQQQQQLRSNNSSMDRMSYVEEEQLHSNPNSGRNTASPDGGGPLDFRGRADPTRRLQQTARAMAGRGSPRSQGRSMLPESPHNPTSRKNAPWGDGSTSPRSPAAVSRIDSFQNKVKHNRSQGEANSQLLLQRAMSAYSLTGGSQKMVRAGSQNNTPPNQPRKKSKLGRQSNKVAPGGSDEEKKSKEDENNLDNVDAQVVVHDDLDDTERERSSSVAEPPKKTHVSGLRAMLGKRRMSMKGILPSWKKSMTVPSGEAGGSGGPGGTGGTGGGTDDGDEKKKNDDKKKDNEKKDDEKKKKKKKDDDEKKKQEAEIPAPISVEKYIENICDVYSYTQNRPSDLYRPFFIFFPESAGVIAWQLIILLITVFYVIKVPWKVGFTSFSFPGETELDQTMDAIFLLDIMLSFVTTYKDEATGEFVFDRMQIARQYLRTWFIIDVAASLPFSFFPQAGGGDGGQTTSTKLIKSLRIFKLLRFFRFKRFARTLQEIQAMLHFNPSMVRFSKSIFVLILIWHFLGCIYWLLQTTFYGDTEYCKCTNETITLPGKYGADGGALRGKQDRPCNTRPHPFTLPNQTLCFVNDCIWYDSCSDDLNVLSSRMALRGEDDIFDEYAPRGLNPDRWVQHPSYADKPFVSQYLQSLFWAVEVTTGIGDDIVPKEDGEVLFTAIVAVIGLIIYSVIIGSASSALQNMDSAGAARRQTLDKVTDYLRYRKVPRFFQKIILDYYEHVHSNVSDKDDGFLEDLPPTLRVRLSLILNRDLVAKVPIFSNFTADVLIRLIQRLVSEMYLPGEYIVKAGQYGDSMHFIKSGKVDVIAPDERTLIVTLKMGEFFGERALMDQPGGPSKRNATIRAVDYCELLILMKHDFDDLAGEASGYSAVQTFTKKLQEVISERDADLATKTEKPKRKHSITKSVFANVTAKARKLSLRRGSSEMLDLRGIEKKEKLSSVMDEGEEGTTHETGSIIGNLRSTFGSLIGRNRKGLPPAAPRMGKPVTINVEGKGDDGEATRSLSAEPDADKSDELRRSLSAGGEDDDVNVSRQTL